MPDGADQNPYTLEPLYIYAKTNSDMIQRIQTIFLALAAAANFGLFSAPFASTPGDVATNALFTDGEYNIQDNVGLILFFSLAGLLALAGIFLYQNRKLQMRVVIFSVAALVVGIAFCLIYYLNHSAGLESTEVNDGFGLYLPVLGLIFTLVAYRFINKDEKLVRSMDRLR